ncbi:MAG: long-chain fatty acid--CoA ligase [Acidobacteria bacterium]|nr:long-chain fatty acid--CoA ligase [Acidobacteriota bacterium]
MPAPDGAALLSRLAAGGGAGERGFADGRHAVSYAEAPRLLDAIDARCARAGVSGRQPLALECSQSVAGALALLWALSRGHDVVLLPELAAASKEAGVPRFIPGFCAHVVTASASLAHRAPSPEAGIVVAANDGFAAEPAMASFRGPDLYLRTSGSTGTPKLTRMSHRKWLDNAAACVERWQLTAFDRLSVPVPIFHSYGFGAAFLPGLLAGAAMDVGSGGNVVRYVEREQRFAPNVAFLTPALCDGFLAVRKSARPYRLAVTAGDKVKRETMAGFEPRFGPLLNLYGSAEMGAVSAASPEDPAAARLGTAGYPLAGVELRVEETGDGLEAAPGERAGRLCCRHAHGSDGYLFLEPAGGQDGARFEPRADGEWFETGDLARLRADGYVEILGRSGLSVKRDGLLVVFADVEAAVEKVEGVQRAVVVAAGESRRGARLVAVCTMHRDGETLPPDAVRRRCFELLPRYAVPDEVAIVDSLPHLPSGKVDRRAVRDLVAR